MAGNRKWLRYLAWALVPLGLYFAHVEYQTWRGEQALIATTLDFKSLDAALAASKASGKPVLADFSAIWCPACRALHADVFTDPAVKAAITGGYELSRIDYESPEAPAFMKRYDVSGFPTLLVLDGDGNLLRRLPLSFDPPAFAASLRFP
ncbi:thioredoxin family protein [Nevskia sp.]|uniref:thioredoxin family protein n=1 Tax=Nevskia sp. TaxID=1929292 RepID=UPI0025FBA234|nr:thioredoxin family protein [Nevskia sp.]